MKEQIDKPVDKALYDSETVLKTAHKFTDRCYIKVNQGDNQIVISFKLKEDSNLILGNIVDEFFNELIDQKIRAIVQKECGQIREQIVKKAFSTISQE